MFASRALKEFETGMLNVLMSTELFGRPQLEHSQRFELLPSSLYVSSEIGTHWECTHLSHPSHWRAFVFQVTLLSQTRHEKRVVWTGPGLSCISPARNRRIFHAVIAKGLFASSFGVIWRSGRLEARCITIKLVDAICCCEDKQVKRLFGQKLIKGQFELRIES